MVPWRRQLLFLQKPSALPRPATPEGALKKTAPFPKELVKAEYDRLRRVLHDRNRQGRKTPGAEDLQIQFMDLNTYPMIVHNIYTDIVRQELEYFFYHLRDNKNKDDFYQSNIFINQSRFIYDIICEHCPSSFNSFFIPLGHHLIIMDCLSDILNGLNYSRWLIQPEKKLLI